MDASVSFTAPQVCREDDGRVKTGYIGMGKGKGAAREGGVGSV